MSCTMRDRKPSLFGSPIITGITRSSYLTDTGLMIPGIVARCFQEINKELKVEGLFRISGATSVLNQLQNQFEQCDNPFDVIPITSVTTVHYWTGLLKRYLQLLPVPLIPSSYQSSFLEALDTVYGCSANIAYGFIKENSLEKFQETMSSMPIEHRHLLIYLLQSLHTMVENRNSNHMTASSMAIIVAPTFTQMDAVSQLMQQSAPSLKLIHKPSWQKTARRLLNFSSRKQSGINQSLSSLSTHSVPFPLYQPQHILQLDIVKQSTKWTRIVEYLICYSFLFLKPLPMKQAQELKLVPVRLHPSPPNDNTIVSCMKTPAPALSQRQTKDIDLSKLEFPASRELLDIFQDVNIPVHFKTVTTANIELRQNYAQTLQHWRSREEESLNNHQLSKHHPSSDWLCLRTKKSLFIEPTMETNISRPHLQLYQHGK